MKKVIIYVLLSVITVQLNAQRTGDLYFGLKGGYIPTYKDFAYGARASYSVTDPFEVSFSFLMNPKINMTEGEGASRQESEISLYSYNLNMNYYILLQNVWATGPTLGGQYFTKKETYKLTSTEKDNSYGLNVGWHLRINFTENVILNGGWRYAATTDDNSHHLFYLGFGYRFNLF
jgi:opacity protein-like surface antigen